MPQVIAYATDNADCQFHKTTVERRDPGPTEIYFDVAYAGICHSDIHTAREEWGPTTFPLVPGHEIAGVVKAVGDRVTKFKVGDPVGVGCFVDSCGACENCRDGWENFCTSTDKPTVWTYGDVGRDGKPTVGGYSSGFTVEQDYACHVPDAIALEHAAPLMCAGVTTYSPLKRWGAGPGKRVGIVGMGGLGHMGVQIAAKMGAETIVLSRTLAKKEDGLKLGASDYFATSDPESLKPLRGTFDLILTTVSDGVDIDMMLRLLKAQGALVAVGLPEHPQTFAMGPLVVSQKILAGSNIGGIPITQEMLNFCADNDIRPVIEMISGEDITAAYDDVVSSKVRYRYVIDTATFSE